ncbi:replication protein A 32 kDa subunit-like [Xylocopa sonorina]|uniref:replication protein A 32 kDa subunit-like n=1 Tax=Xylocopa sonorina TaxID=1818115 RepID=UPI00403AFE0D
MWSNLNSNVANMSGGFFNDNRSTKDSSEENIKRVKNIVPVMIRHLTRSSEDGLRLWGTLIHVVTFVGIVKEIERTPIKMKFEIEDETGCITCLRWLETDKTVSESNIELNTYVRVIGYIRQDSENKYVLILKIMPLTNLNELTTHLLEVTNVMLKAEKMFYNPVKSSNMTKINPAVTTNNDNGFGLTRDQTIVFELVQSKNDTDNGIERHSLEACLPKNILPDLNNIIDFLISEGYIYTTLTDDHFKTT